MKSLYGFVVFCFGLAMCAHGKMTDKEIAAEAAAHASVLLNADVDSEEGNHLLNFAKVLQPESDLVLLLEAYMKRGSTPKPLPIAGTKEAFLNDVKSQAVYLLKSRLKANVELGRLALLYLLLCDAHAELDTDVLSGLAYLQSYGIEGELDDLLSEEWNLEDVYKSRNKPSKVSGAKLSETDQKVAKEAIKVASGILAKDSSSAAGLTLLQFGRHLIPSDSKALLYLMQLERGAEIKDSSSKMDAKQLAAYMVKRGATFLKTAESKELSAHLALLYFRVAEVIDPENQKVMLGIMRMEKLDRSESFAELLEVELADLAPEPAPSLAANSRTNSGPRYGWGTPQQDSDVASKSKKDGPFDPRKLKIKVFKRTDDEKRAGGDSDDEVEHVDMIVTIENWTGVDIEGHKVALHVIGKSVTEKRMLTTLKIFPFELDVANKSELKKSLKLSIPFDDRNSVQYGYYYYGYCLYIYPPGEDLLVTDGNRAIKRLVQGDPRPETVKAGKPLVSKCQPSTLEKNRLKIKDYGSCQKYDSRKCVLMN